eukprot:8271078-Pyramimonas_sp.AAC.1
MACCLPMLQPRVGWAPSPQGLRDPPRWSQLPLAPSFAVRGFDWRVGVNIAFYIVCLGVCLRSAPWSGAARDCPGLARQRAGDFDARE